MRFASKYNVARTIVQQLAILRTADYSSPIALHPLAIVMTAAPVKCVICMDAGARGTS